ncbi:sialidase-1 [Centroberyx affinis]|uniref:sialidase-1 n=1 Tax=Centroberyx affinis TaxID=166261 RepID=UPI003A5BC053
MRSAQQHREIGVFSTLECFQLCLSLSLSLSAFLWFSFETHRFISASFDGVKSMLAGVGSGSNMGTRGRRVPLTLLVWAALLPCVFTRLRQIEPLLVEEQLLWGSKWAEVDTYRIPLITFTPRGSLLVFAEARKDWSRDIGKKFIALKRSTDRGATWSPISFIENDGQRLDGMNLGAVVVDEETKSVILIYSMCFHNEQCSPSSTMMIESKDDGLSWTAPRNLSIQLGVMSFAPGPGFGIQKRYLPHKGRLVVCGHGKLDRDGVFCILSDDHGKNWRNGAELKSIPYKQEKKYLDFTPDECQPFEMTDGSIVINVRNQNNYHCQCRIVVRSFDGGETLPLDQVSFDHALVDPVVAAGALQKEGVLYFTNPASTVKREKLTLRWSLTNGTTWEDNAVQIWAGPSGYSSMTSLDSGKAEDRNYIYIIYEKGHNVSDETISFVKIHLYGGL